MTETAFALPERETRIDWSQVRLLLAASWRIKWNRARQKPLLAAVKVLATGWIATLIVTASVMLGLWVNEMRDADLRHAAAAVHAIYLSVFLLLALTPVLGFRGNEFLDVTKLFVYPIGHRTAFASTLFGLMGSLAVVFFSLPLFAVVIGYARSIDELLVGLAAALLLLVVAVAIGQFLLLAFLNTLKSRWWRDISMVIVPLAAGGIYLVWILVMHSGDDGGQRLWNVALENFARWKDWTLPLPSWWSAHMTTGKGLVRFVPGIASVALVVWLVRASALLQERAYHGEVNEPAGAESVAARGPIGRLASHLRDPLGALVEKELSLLRREPAVRSILIGQAMYPVLYSTYFVYELLHGRSMLDFARYVSLGGLISFPLLLMELGLVMNLLGLEGGGAVHAMLLPVKRSTLLLGKSIAYLMAFGTLNAVLGIVATTVVYVLSGAGPWTQCVLDSFLAGLEGFCVLAVGLGVGSVHSVLFPQRVAVRDRRVLRQQVAGREGCLRSLVQTFVVLSTAALALPIGICFHVPVLWQVVTKENAPAWLLFVTVPIAVVIAVGAVAGGASIGGSLLEDRDEETVARLAKSDD